MRNKAMLAAVVLLGAVMLFSFAYSTWATQQTELPAKSTEPCSDEDNTVACQTFEAYSFGLVLIGMILAVCMVGATYLAKMEAKP